MVQQFYYREFSSMKKRVDGFLKKSKHLKVVRRDSDHIKNTVVYTLRPRWRLVNLLLFQRNIKLSVIQVDVAITRLELHMKKGEREKINLFSKSTCRLLDNLVFLF